MSKLQSLLKSRRFWAAASVVVGVVASDFFGVELDTDQLATIAAAVVAWIVGDTVRPTE